MGDLRSFSPGEAVGSASGHRARTISPRQVTRLSEPLQQIVDASKRTKKGTRRRRRKEIVIRLLKIE